MDERGKTLDDPLGSTNVTSIMKSYQQVQYILTPKFANNPDPEQFAAMFRKSKVDLNFCYLHLKSNTLLHIAVAKGYVKLVEWIIEHLKFPTDINIENDAGDTPLHMAVAFYNSRIIECLLKNKADINKKNTADNTPLHLASKEQKDEIKKFLELRENQSNVQEESIPTQSRNTNGEHDTNEQGDFPILPRTHRSVTNIHGITYQFTLLMLFLVRAYNLNHPFSLGTEVSDADKFDDAVLFLCRPGETKSCFVLQAKHKGDTIKGKICMKDLLTTNKKGDFSLLKYFQAYIKIRERSQDNCLHEVEQIDYFLCSNAGFHFNESSSTLSEGDIKCVLETDETPYPDFFKEGKRYKIGLQGVEQAKFIPKLKKIYYDFFNIEKAELESAIRESALESVIKDNKIIKDKITSLNALIKYVEPNNTDINTVNVLKCFLEKLYFVVEQPNEDELDKTIETEFGKNFSINLKNNELINSAFLRKCYDWFREKRPERGHERTFLSRDNAKQFIDSIFSNVNNLISSGISRAHTEKLKAFNVTFSPIACEKIKEKIISQRKIVHLISSMEIVSSTKVVQALDSIEDFKKDDSYLFLQLSTLLMGRTQKTIEDSFSSRGVYNLLAIECSQADKDAFGLYINLSNILQNNENKSKKLIIIAEENHPFANMFKVSVGFIQYTDVNTYLELSCKSQTAFFDKSVMYLDNSTKVKNIITGGRASRQKQLDALPLSILFEEDNSIEIGKDLSSGSNNYDDSWHVDLYKQ